MFRSKEYCIKTLHQLYRKDKWINELFKSAGLNLDNLSAAVDEIYNNIFFDTATERAIKYYERELSITPAAGQSLDDRRAVIRARWVGAGKIDILLLQEVANSWKYGTTALEFIGGRIHVKFISPIGVPDDIQALKDVLEDTKPAHLAIFYTFLWLTWGQAKDYGSWRQHKANGSWLDVKRLKEG